MGWRVVGTPTTYVVGKIFTAKQLEVRAAGPGDKPGYSGVLAIFAEQTEAFYYAEELSGRWNADDETEEVDKMAADEEKNK